jgi:hypothetical protein
LMASCVTSAVDHIEYTPSRVVATRRSAHVQNSL